MEDAMDILQSVLRSLGTQSPMFVVMFLGVIVAIVRWRHHPPASMLVLAAVVLSTVTSVAVPFVYAWLPRAFDFGEIEVVYLAVSLVAGTLYAMIWGLLLAAAFGWRKSSR